MACWFASSIFGFAVCDTRPYSASLGCPPISRGDAKICENFTNKRYAWYYHYEHIWITTHYHSSCCRASFYGKDSIQLCTRYCGIERQKTMVDGPRSRRFLDAASCKQGPERQQLWDHGDGGVENQTAKPLISSTNNFVNGQSRSVFFRWRICIFLASCKNRCVWIEGTETMWPRLCMDDIWQPNACM